MKKRVSVLLIDDNIGICEKTESYINSLDDICLVGITADIFEGLRMTKELLPDAVILDLELCFGKGNGLLYLFELNKDKPKKMPFILVTTNSSSSVTYNFARNNGADFIMPKQTEDYTPEGAIDLIRMMSKEVCGCETAKITPTEIKPAGESLCVKKRRKERIFNELNRVGISPKAIGYQYLADAILINIDMPQKNLCVKLSEMYRKTDSSIERAMQNAINRAWRTGDLDELSCCYTARINSERGTPTLNEFIFYYAAKVKNEE